MDGINEREKWVKIQELYEAASAAIDRGDAGSALEFLARIIEIEPDEPEVLNLRGVAHFYRHDYDKAKAFFKQVTINAPRLYKAWHNLGILYQIENELETALEYITRAVEIEPMFAKAWRSLGDCYIELGDMDLAREAFLTAVEIDENDLISMYNLARICAIEGYNEKAIKWLRDATRDPFIKESTRREAVFADMMGEEAFLELVAVEG
ncbi:MAG: tetratricopeptide repeat protein [bacterium]|nr:tetratricopeptide repeat protein [bacterium]